MFYPLSSHKFLSQHSIDFGNETVAADVNNKSFILPSFPELTDEQFLHIFNTLDKYLLDIDGR